ncbi:MAG: hypothetical protein WAX89_05185, partial [Alphaproteobacteria bacterium]
VQFHLSAMGDLQLDGLWHNRNIQLKLRLQEEPGTEFREGLARMVESQLQGYGLTGSVQIEVRAETEGFPVSPLTDILLAEDRHQASTPHPHPHIAITT